jgi:hypothetical protein
LSIKFREIDILHTENRKRLQKTDFEGKVFCENIAHRGGVCAVFFEEGGGQGGDRLSRYSRDSRFLETIATIATIHHLPPKKSRPRENFATSRFKKPRPFFHKV